MSKKCTVEEVVPSSTYMNTVLYCTLLYCTVLYCTVLYCTVLYFTVHELILLEVSHNSVLNKKLIILFPQLYLVARELLIFLHQPNTIISIAIVTIIFNSYI